MFSLTLHKTGSKKLASELGIKSVRFASFSALSNSYITVPSRLADIEGRNITFEDLKKPPPGYPRNSNIFLKAFEAMYLMFFFKRFDEKNFTGSERVLQGFSVCSLIVFRWRKEIEESYLDY